MTAATVEAKLRADGYQITTPSDPTKLYTFEASKGDRTVAVQVKEFRVKVSVAHVQQFQEYLGLDGAKRFSEGWMVSTNGFGKPALTHIETEKPSNVRLGTIANEDIVWQYPSGGEKQVVPPEPPAKLRYFGVFTCKGGVGKTTVAAHLAGAFALMGFDVVLVDLDPQKNLRKLFLQDPSDENGDASLFVPPATRGGAGATLTVLNHDEWNEQHYPNVKIVVCDCSPTLSENPSSLVSKFDYCIIPTTLNPLGVAKRGDVVTRTFAQLREMNKKAEMFAVINGYDSTKEAESRNHKLLELLNAELGKYTPMDSKCKFIHPDDAKIRYSTALFYWGMHIVTKTSPKLAFEEVAGRSYPRTDFLQFVDYLQSHTDIDSLKKQSGLAKSS